jgi:hypothetical protein
MSATGMVPCAKASGRPSVPIPCPLPQAWGKGIASTLSSPREGRGGEDVWRLTERLAFIFPFGHEITA